MSDFQPFANSLSPEFGSVVRPADWLLDAGLVRRIKRAYRLALEKPDGSISMWTTTIRERQHPVHDALMSEDDAVTAAALSNPA